MRKWNHFTHNKIILYLGLYLSSHYTCFFYMFCLFCASIFLFSLPPVRITLFRYPSLLIWKLLLYNYLVATQRLQHEFLTNPNTNSFFQSLSPKCSRDLHTLTSPKHYNNIIIFLYSQCYFILSICLPFHWSSFLPTSLTFPLGQCLDA